MGNLVYALQQIGCVNAKSDRVCKISELRDKRWVKMLGERGYDRGVLIFPDGGHSSFFLVLPDRNIASADNHMCANGFYAVAEELGFDADEILGEEPYGEYIMYEDEDGIEYEDCVVTIWSPEQFNMKLKQCKGLANSLRNESKKNTVIITESELERIVIESIKRILKEDFDYNCE